MHPGGDAATFEIYLLFMTTFCLYGGVRTKQVRDRVRERARRDLVNEDKPDIDTLEAGLGELKMMDEELEQELWLGWAFVVAMCAQLNWHLWYVSVAIGVGWALVGIKFLSLKPWTTELLVLDEVLDERSNA